MKKLLIVSLFLLSMIGLFAQGVPFNQIFVLQTETGGFHPENTIAFTATEYHSTLDYLWDAIYPGSPRVVLEWNWDGQGQNSDNLQSVVYDPGTGELTVQMAPMIHWGGAVVANFTFKDLDGNEYGPVTVTKPASGANQVHPDIIAWGGPAGPAGPDAWATIGTPADAAMDVMLDAQLTWTYEGSVAPTGYELIWNGGDAMDLGNVMTYDPDLAYGTTYTWSIKPYVDDSARKGMKASRNYLYPEGMMPEWSFTTMDEPVVYPTWAINVAPEDDADGVALMPTFEWTYTGPAADGYEVYIGEDMVADVDVMTYTLDYDLEYNTDYTWGVKPYILEDSKGLRGMKAVRDEPGKLYPTEGEMPTTSFTTTNQIPAGDVVITVPDGVTNPNPPVDNPDPVIPEIPVIPAGLEYIAVTINQPTAGLYGITFTLPQAYGSMRVLLEGIALLLDTPDVDGQYYEVNGLNVTVWVLFAGGAKEEKDIVIVDDDTLPVTLSSFTAQAHANEYVTLKWVTESESNLQGYNVYRAETDNQDQAIRINPTVVAANNQTQTQTYTYTDNEVEATTYYYWLEVAELANENTFHGPIVVTVEDDPVVPGITETTFRNFGPSPFTESTSTTLRVKEGETATVTIYNLLGQVVRRESFNAGEHNFEFNGRDLNNKKVANGIYFVRMTSPTQTHNFKIVKIK